MRQQEAFNALNSYFNECRRRLDENADLVFNGDMAQLFSAVSVKRLNAELELILKSSKEEHSELEKNLQETSRLLSELESIERLLIKLLDSISAVVFTITPG